MRTRLLLVLGGVGLLAIGTAWAEPKDKSLPEPAKGYRWEDEAKQAGLSDADIESLRQQKLLVARQEYRQVFSPYIRSEIPFFITSDSLLNAYHVLFEESVARMAEASAGKLSSSIRPIWNQLITISGSLKGQPQLVATANLRSRIILGVALRLLDDWTFPIEDAANDLINLELARVRAATDCSKPAWLGPPDDGFVALDYTRYRPRGLYVRTAKLEKYFRAVSWLQSIPLRVSVDEELATAIVLAHAVGDARIDTVEAKFLGVPDDWIIGSADSTILANTELDFTVDRIRELRNELLQRAKEKKQRPKVNDQIRFPPHDGNQVADAGFRMVASYRLPDAELFQRTTDLRTLNRPFPLGLEICAALGSGFAAAEINGPQSEIVRKAIEDAKPLFKGTSLYQEYLSCLATLVCAPEHDAPSFMATDAWQRKSCQTVLGGWAQLRHTWVLQAKQTASYRGRHDLPPGFVEPVPEFFARMASLIDKSEHLLDRAGAFEPYYESFASDLRGLEQMLRRAKRPHRKIDTSTIVGQLMVGNRDHVANFLWTLDYQVTEFNPKRSRSFLIPMTARIAADLEKGILPADAKLAASISAATFPLESSWKSLESLCRRLEALAHKQLRGVPWSAEEDRFLKSFGAKLANVMLYRGNSYLASRDDAPRIVDVFTNANLHCHLEVGIGRPQALYILYPWKGGEILCRGAVMPYYEFNHPSRLTDAEWKAMLDNSPPPRPSWLQPILGKDAVTPKVLKE